MFRDIKKRLRRYLKVGSSSDKDQDDTNKYRCKVCGAICDKRTTEVAKPRPDASSELIGTQLVADGSIYAPNVTKGCWNCGTLYSR